MAVPDYLRFEQGNPIAGQFAGQWFQTTDLFGYFEKFYVRTDGTLWLTPTQVVPAGRLRADIESQELVKVELPAVQIVLHNDILLTGETSSLIARFNNGILVSVRDKHY